MLYCKKKMNSKNINIGTGINITTRDRKKNMWPDKE